ncbi:hypothetical protein K439DRAFT_1558765 [Ramaria rubella]|nr:hypothetical protein K439DRAFT_1558765 [Ramaria rubella]
MFSDNRPDLTPPAKGQAMASLKTVKKIVLDKAPKAISPLREPLSTEPTPAIDVCNSHHTSTDNSNNGAPSPTPDWQGPHRSQGKETTSQPFLPGYVEDPIIANVKLLRLGSKGNTNLHAYFTAIFYNWLNIAQGAVPFMQLSMLEEYWACGVPAFQSKSFLHTIFLTGFCIENWPYCAPTPMAIDDTDFASLLSWASWKITMVIKQFCHPEPDHKLWLVCCTGDTQCMPFINPADASGNPAPDVIDFPKTKLPKGSKYRLEGCYCALHNGWQTTLPRWETTARRWHQLLVPPPEPYPGWSIKAKKKSTRKALLPVPRHERSKMATVMINNNPNSSKSEDTGDGDMSDNEPLGLLLTIHETDAVEPSPMIRMLRGGKEVVIKSNYLEAEDAVEYMDLSPLEKHNSALGNDDSDAESHNTKHPKAMGNDIMAKQLTNALGIPSISTKLFIAPGAQSSIATPACAEQQKLMPPATPCHPPPVIAKPCAVSNGMIILPSKLTIASTSTIPPIPTIPTIPAIANPTLPSEDPSLAHTNVIAPLTKQSHNEWTKSTDTIYWVAAIFRGIECRIAEGASEKKGKQFYSRVIDKFAVLYNASPAAPLWCSFIGFITGNPWVQK